MPTEFEIVEQKSRSVLNRAHEIFVRSDEEYSLAGEFIMGCKTLIREIQGKYREPKAKTDAAHKAVVAMERDALAPVQFAVDIVSATALDYKREQDRLAEEERKRIEDERRRLAEEAQIKEAERLEAEGKTDQADAVLSAPLELPRPIRIESAVPKVAGLSTKKQWKAKIVAPSKVKPAFCLPDQTLINCHVQSFFAYISDSTEAQRAALTEEIGGVELYLDETFAGRIAK